MREGEVVRTFRADGADIAGATYAGGIKVEPGVVAYGGVRADLMFREPERGDWPAPGSTHEQTHPL